MNKNLTLVNRQSLRLRLILDVFFLVTYIILGNSIK